jgi:hypothetical protein
MQTLIFGHIACSLATPALCAFVCAFNTAESIETGNTMAKYSSLEDLQLGLTSDGAKASGNDPMRPTVAHPHRDSDRCADC